MSYILNIDHLQMADIVLTKTKSMTSKAIRASTLGPYSHAMLYVGNSLIHADGGGVFSKNPQRIIFEKESDAIVLRSRQKISREIEKIICDYARNKTGSLYSVKEAVQTIKFSEGDSDAKNKSQFCSRLVAQSYLEAGLKIVKNANYCSPNDLYKSDRLKTVNNTVREASENEIWFSESVDFVQKHQEHTFEWLNKARSIAKNEGVEVQTIDDVFSFLAIHQSYDHEISQAIIDSGFLDDYKHDRQVNPHRFDSLHFASIVRHHPEALQREIKNEVLMIEKNIINFYNICNSPLREQRITQLHLDLYKNILNEQKERIEVIIETSRLVQDVEIMNEAKDLKGRIERTLCG